MTLGELQTLREKIVRQLAQPESMQAGSLGIRNRSVADLQTALSKVDGEIAALSSSSTVRTTRVVHSRT